MGRKVNEECRERNMPCPSGLAGLDDDVYAHCLHTHPCVHSCLDQCIAVPNYKQWGKYTENGVLGATGHFAGAHLHAPLSVWVLVLAANGTGLKVSKSSLEIPRIIASPSATQVWQHLQMSLPVRKIFCVSHPLEWRLPIKCLFPTA